MTRFLDGPAVGEVLFLKRAPMYLRAVQDAGGKWDALDLLDDAPALDERIIVYKLEGDPSYCHINRRGGGGGVFHGGNYRLVSPQPQDEQVRTIAAWRAWVGTMAGGTIAEDGSLQT